jgi:hypothetical protein
MNACAKAFFVRFVKESPVYTSSKKEKDPVRGIRIPGNAV